MKYFRFAAWFAAAVTILVLAGTSVHTLFNLVMPAFDISGNRATAAGYTMELVASATAFVLVLWRLVWALEANKTVEEIIDLMRTRTAILSLGISGVIGMTFINRSFWWTQHMFTGNAFDNGDIYTNAANSVIISLLMCVIVYALHARPSDPAPLNPEIVPKKRKHLLPQGIPAAVYLYLISLVAFFIGGMAYQPQF